MRTVVIFVSFSLLAMSAHASPTLKHIVTVTPRAVGRTAENMVTFKDRNLAFHEWLLMAAIMANAGSDINLYHRCQNCYELDTFIYGLRPSAGRVIGTELVGAMAYSTVQQVAWEASYGEHSREWRGFTHWFPTVTPVLVYSWLTYCNTTVPSDGSRSANDTWLFGRSRSVHGMIAKPHAFIDPLQGFYRE